MGKSVDIKGFAATWKVAMVCQTFFEKLLNYANQEKAQKKRKTLSLINIEALRF